jgi:hypothetical protein
MRAYRTNLNPTSVPTTPRNLAKFHALQVGTTGGKLI